MKNLQSVRIGATFVAEPVEPSLRFWLSMLGIDARIEFAPYNQVFQELLRPESGAARVRGVNLVFIRLEDWLAEAQAHSAPPIRHAGAAPAAHSRWRLPNGIEVAELNRAETDHLYREIFQNRAYLRHGIQLRDSAVVVDCGANIGMFSLFAHLHARDVRILAVEPSPRTADVLRSNAAMHGMAMTVVDAGLSDRDGEAAFTFYENYSLVSSFDAGREEDESFLRAAIHSTLGAEGASQADAGVVQALSNYLVSERLQTSQAVRPIRRLGGLLREHGIGHIDLLKIDVEKAELKVLSGIEPEQWPAIQQIVMEIHDRAGAIESTVVDLERRGFRVVLEEERDLKNTGVWNLFAVRPEYQEDLQARQASRDQEIVRNIRDLAEAARDTAGRNPSLLAVVIAPPSPLATAASRNQSLHELAVRTLQEGTSGLSNVMVIDAHDAADRYACPAYYDWKADELGHMPYSAIGYDTIGTVAARALHAWIKPATKVVVLDCDNTLWGGVCGEDGPNGLEIGPNHRRLHEELTTLQEAGVLLALNSKNEAGDVWAVFDGRSDLGLRRDQFVTSRLNWSPKSENLRSMASELNLGLDSFVFIDDNPVECAEVRAHAPEVIVLQWPTDSARGLRFLDHLWPLDIGPTTDEDRKRTSLYQQEVARKQLREASTSLEAFLSGLELEVTIAPVAPAQIPRAAQLTERTNQFNFTTIRRTEEDLRRLLADGADVLILHAKDRFGDYGLVGLAVATPVAGRSTLAIDTFLMSCRVLGKGVEHRLLAALGARARDAGLEFVELPYQPTARNRPAWLFGRDVFLRDVGADSTVPFTFVMPAIQAAAVVFHPMTGANPVADDGQEGDGARPATFTVRPDYQRIAGELDTAAKISAAVHPILASAGGRPGTYDAPSTDTEKTLVRIWADLLHIERIGVHENFFAIGGDSIVGIQVLSRASQAGLALEMKDLFEHETVFELARAVEARQVVESSDVRAVPGSTVALTPIQRWFFEKDLPAPEHWNMEMVVDATGEVDAGLLTQSLDALLRHHDALRYRYRHTEGTWQQRVGEPDETAVLESVLLTDGLDGRRAEMAAIAARLHAGLNLGRGPLIRAALCVPDGGSPARIILVAHHLVSDGITWRVILEDLDTAYGQLAAGQPVSLPRRSSSYSSWAEKLTAYGASESLSAELVHWRAVTADGGTPIRPDHPDAEALATERTLTVTPSVFSVEETRRLLQQVPQVFDTHVNDVLLAALAVAFDEIFGCDSLLVDLEGHGREPLFDRVDLSRTVGWFTTVFPVRVDACDGDLRQSVAAARRMRQAIPKRGIGYGVLRYLHPDTEVRQSLASACRAEVMFNYLGQFDQALRASARFSLSPDVDLGPLHGPDGRRSHLFEIIGRVVSGQLRLDWMYSRALFDVATVARLIESYERALRGILELARETGPAELAPSRTTLHARVGGRQVEETYGLAPIQQLFLVALNGGLTVGLDQWRCRIEGTLNPDVFRRAWNHVVAAHGAMRTAFVSDLADGPRQVVLRDAILPWHEADISTLSPSAQTDAIATYVDADRQRGFDPLDPPLMRVALFRLSSDRWEMVWTFHHLLIDGWSCPLVFAAVGEAYDALLANRTAPTSSVPYARYVTWLDRHQPRDSEPFWRSYLSEFTTPTTLPRTSGSTADVIERAITLSSADTASVHESARRWRVSLNTLLQLAWALVISRHTGKTDVVFGVAFSGRPSELPEVERIIGPFVNNLPIRTRLEAGRSLEAEAKALQRSQFDLLPHQAAPLSDVQRWSEVPPGARLFESLLVLQSYTTAAGLRRLGEGLLVTSIDAPVRTNYPLTVIAEPGPELSLRLNANPGTFAPTDVERLLADFAESVRSFAAEETVSAAWNRLSTPTDTVAPHPPRVRSAHPLPARAGLESDLLRIWKQAFGLEDIGVNETFAELGGQSLLMLRIHAEIERTLSRRVSIVALFQHPTIRLLAAHMEAGEPTTERADAARSRAAKQSEALARQPRRRRT